MREFLAIQAKSTNFIILSPISEEKKLELWISQTIERIVLKFWIEQEFQATILDKEFLSKATFLLLIEAFKDNYEHNFKLCLACRRELSSEEQNLNFHNQAVLLIHRTHNIDCLT